MVDEDLVVVVVVVVSFFFKPSSLLTFVLHFLAFNSSSWCGGTGEDDAVVAVPVVVTVLGSGWVVAIFIEVARKDQLARS